MADFFDPIEYLAYLRRHAKFALIAIGTAVGLTAAVSFLLPKQYTATATLVIEPPSGMDPRGTTAVSAIYLESLKAYEQFAASDSLFERARQKFQLQEGAATETLRRRVLRVTKLPDTKVLQIKATLRNREQAQALVQFLAEETVALNRSVESQSEREALAEIRKQVDEASANLSRARAQLNTAESGGTESVLADEVRNLSDLKGRLNEQIANAATSLAELSARGDSAQDIAAARARGTALAGQIATVSRDLVQKAAALAAVRARTDQSVDQLRAATTAFEAMSRRANELAGSSGLRTEQLRIIDPGIVPQQPSFPNIPLFTAAALLIGSMLSVAWLSLRYGLEQQRVRSARSEFKVARSGSR